MGPLAASSSSRGALASIAASVGVVSEVDRSSKEKESNERQRTLLLGLVLLLVCGEKHVVW
jgi:hypothetical protein